MNGLPKKGTWFGIRSFSRSSASAGLAAQVNGNKARQRTHTQPPPPQLRGSKSSRRKGWRQHSCINKSTFDLHEGCYWVTKLDYSRHASSHLKVSELVRGLADGDKQNSE